MDASRRIPRTVWVLGGVSLFMDMSSELIHAVLPVYMTAVLGLSVLTVGIVEGIAEATASISKVFSGYVSDRFARRKPLVLLGYGLSAFTKPMFPLADGAVGVVAARFADRIGKGIRGAPRDALVADVTPPGSRDAAYGLRQALDTVGAFVGPLLAMLFLWMWANDLRAVLWVAVVPAFLAVALIVAGVEEPGVAKAHERGAPIRLANAAAMPAAFWRLIVL
ncbi:MAG: MFS transporter, partial [Burkholderiaceae bacterium]